MMHTYEQPQYIEYLKWMRRFYEKGYWTTDVLNNQTAVSNAFVAGEAAAMYNLNPDGMNWIYPWFKVTQAEMAPNAELAVFDMGLEHNVLADTTSPMGTGCAVPALSAAKVPDVLRFIEVLYTDQEIHHLWRYVVLGTDYEILDNGRVRILNEDNQDIPSGFYPIYENRNFQREPEEGYWSGWAAFKQSIIDRSFVNPLVDFSFDSEPVTAIMSNLANIHDEFVIQLYMGFQEDVDGAVADVNQRFETAGLAEYEAEVLRQIQAYIEDMGVQASVTK
jgi:hypothetical protein